MSRNLLKNGDFEGGWTHRSIVFPTQGAPYEAERGEIFTPEGWITFFKHGLPVEHDPDNQVGWAQPEVQVINKEPPFLDPPRIRSGKRAVKLFTFWKIHDAGLYQRVAQGVQQGMRLQLSAWAHAWSNQADDPYTSINDENISLMVGIDPKGGTNPWAESVVWSEPRNIYDRFGRLRVTAEAHADVVTVFLRSRVLWPYKHCDVYWDAAELVVQEIQVAEEAEIRFDPAEPVAGEPVQVIVQSESAFASVGLTVLDPTGRPVMAQGGGHQKAGAQHTWQWQFTPPRAGTYTMRFTVEQGARTVAETTVAVKPPAVSPCRGTPREPYKRTYVLLPPGADRRWVQAILDSGLWEQERWTIGASADDAGIGDLDDRTVIAVNPAAWPDDLAAFFERYYPGVTYKPLNVSTPAELREALREMGTPR